MEEREWPEDEDAYEVSEQSRQMDALGWREEADQVYHRPCRHPVWFSCLNDLCQPTYAVCHGCGRRWRWNEAWIEDLTSIGYQLYLMRLPKQEVVTDGD